MSKVTLFLQEGEEEKKRLELLPSLDVPRLEEEEPLPQPEEEAAEADCLPPCMRKDSPKV